MRHKAELAEAQQRSAFNIFVPLASLSVLVGHFQFSVC